MSVHVSYNDNIPNPPNNPSQDVTKMQTNTNSTRAVLEVDHYGFNNNSGGYHKIIHQPIQLANPTPTVDMTQIFSKNYTPDTAGGTPGSQLYMTNNGGTIQMTGTLQGNDGWSWSNGILYQWGVVALSTGTGTSSHRTGSVTFKNRVTGAIPFPTNCFIVNTNLTCATTSQVNPSSTTLGIFSKSITGFTWVFNTSSNITDTPNFYWFAIGN